MPLACRIARAMVGTHAGTLAQHTHSIPASRRALLGNAKGLDNPNGAKAVKESSNSVFKPRLRDVPGQMIWEPLWLGPTVVPKPISVALGEGEANQEWSNSSFAKHDWQSPLLPDAIETRVSARHWMRA